MLEFLEFDSVVDTAESEFTSRRLARILPVVQSIRADEIPIYLGRFYKIPCLKENAEGKNLFIKLMRLGKERGIKIFYQEPREPTAEQLADAKKFYSIINAEHKHAGGDLR